MSAAIRIDPKYTVAITNRGNAYRSKDDLDRAIGDYNEAIRLAPRYAFAIASRGIAYDDRKEL